MNMRERLTRTISDILLSARAFRNKSNKIPIIAVYLFGSFASGTGKNASDVDLAFLFYEKYYKQDPFRSLQEAELLSMEIRRRIRKPVDVVILNSVSLSFSCQVIRRGNCIYESSAVDRILYEVAAQNKCEEFMPFIEELRSSKREKLLGRD